MCRTCQWITDPDALRHGAPAALRVTVAGGTHCWWVAPAPKGYRVTEELPSGAYGETSEIDATFGPSLTDWDCDCTHFRARNARGMPHGCLHTRALHAAVNRAGLDRKGVSA